MHILMIRLSALGDLLRTLPALHELRRAFPQARITWLAQDMARDLLDGHPEVDEWLYFPRKEWTDAKVLARFLKNLREREYDLILDFHGRFKSAALLVAARGKRKIGLAPPASREGACFFYREIVPCSAQNRIEQSFCLLRHIGVAPALEWKLPVPNEAQTWAEQQVRALEGRRLIFMFPATSRAGHHGARKEWSVEGFCALGRRLLAGQRDAAIMVGHGPGEEETARAVVKGIGGGAVLAPATTLSQIAALISRASLYIGGDTGPTHLAWLLKVPTVALFLSTSPAVNGAPSSASWYRAVELPPSTDEAVRRASEAAEFLLKK